jgi:hypothetical protein
MADETTVTLTPGLHSFAEVFERAEFDLAEHATVDYGAGPFVDHRRVTVGGLTFDDPNNTFVIPEAADRVEIRGEGDLKKSLPVDKDGTYRTVNDVSDAANLPS